MSTYVIEVGIDPDQMRVAETADNFGAFATKEAAARRLIEEVDARVEELRRSRAHARRIISKAKSS